MKYVIYFALNIQYLIIKNVTPHIFFIKEKKHLIMLNHFIISLFLKKVNLNLKIHFFKLFCRINFNNFL